MTPQCPFTFYGFFRGPYNTYLSPYLKEVLSDLHELRILDVETLVPELCYDTKIQRDLAVRLDTGWEAPTVPKLAEGVLYLYM